MKFQKEGVDFVWVIRCDDADGNPDGIRSLLIDVKMDRLFHRTGNLFLETKSSKNKDGCLLTASADVFVFYDPFGKNLFLLNVQAAKEWIEWNADGYERKKVKNEGYVTEGYAIPVQVLIDELVVEKEEMVETKEPLPF